MRLPKRCLPNSSPTSKLRKGGSLSTTTETNSSLAKFSLRWRSASRLSYSPRITQGNLNIRLHVTGSSLQDTEKHQNTRITFSLPSTCNSCIFMKGFQLKKNKIKIVSVCRNPLGQVHTLLFFDPNWIAKLNQFTCAELAFSSRNS